VDVHHLELADIGSVNLLIVFVHVIVGTEFGESVQHGRVLIMQVARIRITKPMETDGIRLPAPRLFQEILDVVVVVQRKELVNVDEHYPIIIDRVCSVTFVVCLDLRFAGQLMPAAIVHYRHTVIVNHLGYTFTVYFVVVVKINVVKAKVQMVVNPFFDVEILAFSDSAYTNIHCQRFLSTQIFIKARFYGFNKNSAKTNVFCWVYK
jgi:hypothetical protein